MSNHEFRPWPKQDKALFAYLDHGARVTIFAAGVQVGKTTVGVQWLKLLLLMYQDESDNFIITSPSFRILEQSTLPPFLRAMDGHGTFHRQGMYFQVYGGGRVWMRTATDADSVVGITNVRAILCDEAGLYPRYFFDNISARAAFRQAPIMIVTSPYSQNWLYTDYVRKLEKDPNAFEGDVVLIQARSDESPYFPRAEYERQKKLMDARRFEMVFGGAFGRMEGLVYDCFDDDENMCPQTTILPPGAVFYAGVDWGVTHAFVIHVRAVTPSGDHYQVAETFSPGLNPTMMAQAAASAKLTWGIKTFYADPSQPGMIKLFNSKGIPCVAANNDIKVGIGYHYELIKTRRFKIFQKVAPHSIDQYSTYHYPSPKDLKQDQDEKAIKPVKVNDDALDAARYCTIMTYHLSEPKRRAGVPGEMGVDVNRLPHDEVIAIRKRANRRDRSERWS
jgi:hypothetical protein